MSDDFETYQRDTHPPGHRGTWGAKWGAALGRQKDTTVTRARDAVLAGFPDDAPADALGRHLADTSLIRVTGESDDSVRLRVRTAWEAWRWAGTTRGIHAVVRLFGWRGVQAVPNARWPIDASGQWSRYRVYITGLTVSDEVVSGVAVSGAYVGLGVDVEPLYSGAPGCVSGQVVSGTQCGPEIVEPLRAALRLWSNARDQCFSVVLTWGGAISGAIRSGSANSGSVAVAWRGSPYFA